MRAEPLAVTAALDDRKRLLDLLQAFAVEPVAGHRRDLLRLAIDLFDINQHFETPVDAGQRAELDALFDLIEIVEMSDPRSRLFVTRGLELKGHLERYLHARPLSLAAPPADAEPALLARCERLRERADLLLERFAPATLAIAA
ncbi:hypothetical protein [Solimonas soli]|uniref:hypothetical protein n=1 Tax=Solimonas soli TaxID=413479 RepID=UPI0005BB195A|nr:hypothetical protein [Solimonas soli]